MFWNVHAVVCSRRPGSGPLCHHVCVSAHRFGRFWTTFDWTLFKAQLANALPFGIGGLAFATQADLHNYFVSHYFDPAQFAIYAVGCFQLPLLGMLFESVVSVLTPEVARRHAKADYDGIILCGRSGSQLCLFFVPMYVLLFVVRHEFISTLFTHTMSRGAHFRYQPIGDLLVRLRTDFDPAVIRRAEVLPAEAFAGDDPGRVHGLYLGIHSGGWSAQ